MDPGAYRRESRRRWGASAAGWAARAADLRRITMPVSAWMVDAIAPQPGHRLLELAAGTGEVGFLAHELIQPGGELITSDFAPEMLTAAQGRAAQLGLRSVRFKQVDAESIDLEAASVDGVLCRWGYMLMADPEAALRETRRVLRPGGRVALAAWTSAEQNPWSSLIGGELVRRGAFDAPAPDEPGQFAWGEEGTIAAALEAAAFDDVEVEAIDLEFTYPGFDEWIASARDFSSRVADGLGGLPDPEAALAALRKAAEPFSQPDGGLVMPGRTWVAAASA